MTEDPAGFSALELIAVLLLVAILASLGASRHAKTMRTARARDAVRRLVAMGTANRTFAEQHGGRFAHRTRTAATLDGCSGAPCLPCTSPSCPSCSLIACRYADGAIGQTKYYWIDAVSPRAGGGCGLDQPEAGSPMVACASAGEIRWTEKEAARGGGPGYEIVYHGWAYSYHEDGTVRPHRGAPPLNDDTL